MDYKSTEFSVIWQSKEDRIGPFVEVKQGSLKGVRSISRGGKKYHSFYGIPFAKPPIGDLRFEPPVEPEPWKGLRDATKLPPICIQSELFNISLTDETVISGEEDCLYLNVFTPDATFQSLLPVLVFIHGGAFHSDGSISYGPQYIMDYPIIFVTISYRLAIFGFLSAIDDVLPGNYGFKDQTAALRWIQENIVAFGGDPNRVTISGQSAGAGSVHYHLFSHLSTGIYIIYKGETSQTLSTFGLDSERVAAGGNIWKSLVKEGLFHQAISQSGSAFTPGLITTRTARERARALGVLTGCPHVETKALVQCLRRIPAEQLVMAHVKFFVYDRNPLVLFGPVVEPRSVQNAFLTELPWDQNIVNSVPYIIGFTADEGGLIASRILSLPAVLREWAHDYYRMFPLIFSYFETTDLSTSHSITTSIKEFYFGNEEISLRTRINFRKMFADGYFGTTSLETAVRHTNKVYFYLYDHLNTRSWEEEYGNITQKHGASHEDDLISLYYFNGTFPPVTGGPDLQVSLRMLFYWVNFVTKGDPNGGTQVWRPFCAKSFDYLHILTERDVMQQNLIYDRYNFWRQIYPYIYDLYYYEAERSRQLASNENGFEVYPSALSYGYTNLFGK